MPKGIRKRGKTYQVIVTKHSKQYSATCTTLEEAIIKREEMRTTLLSNTDNKIKRISLKDAISKTIATKWEDTKGIKTAKINAEIIAKFFGYETPIDQITTEKINEFVQVQKTKGSANSTINRKLSCLSVIIQTMDEMGYRINKPTFMRRPEYKGRERFLTEKEEQELLTLLQLWGKKEHFLCTIIMLDTGMRISETLRLTQRDFDWNQGKYGVVNIWQTKNNSPRSIPLTKRVAYAIKTLNQQTALFQSCGCKAVGVRFSPSAPSSFIQGLNI